MKLAISVGELSADEHAAEVVAALKSQHGEIEVRGMGGRNLRAIGVDTIVDSEKDASVMGFKELFGSLRKVVRSFRTMETLLREWNPDALLLLDYADFNMRLAAKAKNLGVPVIYYIPPQMWAWREGRVEAMKRNVNKAALIFPFEKDFYNKRGYLDTRYVGHPFLNRLKDRSHKRTVTRKSLGLTDNDKLLVIFPGSRSAEIDRHISIVRNAVKILRASHQNIVPVIGVAHSLSGKSQQLLASMESQDGIRLHKGDSFDLLCAGDAGIVKSGTSNLQAAFANLPFVMIYKAPVLSEIIVRTLVPTRTFSIVNIIREKTVNELIQTNCTPVAIAAESERLLFDATCRQKMMKQFEEISQQLSSFENVPEFDGTNSAAERVARMVTDVSLVKR